MQSAQAGGAAINASQSSAIHIVTLNDGSIGTENVNPIENSIPLNLGVSQTNYEFIQNEYKRLMKKEIENQEITNESGAPATQHTQGFSYPNLNH